SMQPAVAGDGDVNYPPVWITSKRVSISRRLISPGGDCFLDWGNEFRVRLNRPPAATHHRQAGMAALSAQDRLCQPCIIGTVDGSYHQQVLARRKSVQRNDELLPL